MESLRTRSALSSIAIAALLIAGLGYYLAHSQARARTGIEQEFGRRAALAAKLTAAALSSSSSQWRSSFGGPRAGLADAMRAFESVAPDPQAAVFDARGRALVSWPIGSRASGLRRSREVALALRGRTAISDLAFRGRPRRAFVTLAGPFATRFGRRIGVFVTSSEVIRTFASAYLAGAPAVDGARAYLIDGGDRVLASSGTLRQGAALPDRRLGSALAARRSGSLGEAYFTSAGLAGTRWRVVFSASQGALFAPVEGSTRRAAWVLFSAFTVALLALLGVGASALRTTTQLARSRERERSARQLAHERLHDALTGLPNRVLFLDRTGHALALAGTGRRAIAVLFVDLDRFKVINDSLGHAAGDELLGVLAGRLRDRLRPGDTVSRFGSDEFAVLGEELAGVEDALSLAGRVREVLDRPFAIGGRDVHLTCCIGVALHRPLAGTVDAATLVRDADVAMHRAKAQGPGHVRVFDTDLHDAALARLDTEVALRSAICDGELRVHYQPIVVLADASLRGVEALVRWERPGVGLVAPQEFIGLAEESGLIDELGGWVLQTAMADVSRWAGAGPLPEGFSLSVNVSARQLAGDALQPLVARLLEAWPLDRSALWLEVTESTVAHDPAAAASALRALSALGVRVAIDDFGIGQSSLEQLVRSLPVDILKLDRSFVTHMGEARERAVVAAVGPMAGALRMTAVAEGVETIAQAHELRELGYPLAQGYHFARPVDARRMRELIASGAPILESETR